MAHRLNPNDPAPGFRKPSTDGIQDLEALKGSWVVLYFYPKDFTSGCTEESCDFRDRYAQLDATVLGVSPDPLDSHSRFQQEYALPFPLISDEDHSLAEAYGAWGEKKNYGRVYQGLIRSTFIIDPEGRIAAAMYNVKARGHGERVERRLAELRE